MAEAWRKEMIAASKQVEVIWIYGDTGTGKTLLAQEIASKKGVFFKSGSSRDIFQKYAGEHTIILDEFREECMRYDDLLKILDPFQIQSGGAMGPSRYYDKALTADMFIVTTPYDPYQYYERVVWDEARRKIDQFGQLVRRLTLIIEMDNDNIYPIVISPRSFNPVRIPGVSRPNPYSQAKRPEAKPDPKDVFENLFTNDVADQDTANDEGTKDNDKQ